MWKGKRKMIKTVDIEYVGIEDIQEIIDDIYAVIKEGNHATFHMMPVTNAIYIDINIMIGGFDINKDYDYKFTFAITDKDEDINAMNDCKIVLKRLLMEE